MAYNRHLADKITNIIASSTSNFYEKEMMGGITWMVDEKMCISIFKEELMVRINLDETDELLQRIGARQMIHGNKPAKGYLTIAPLGFDSDDDLGFWVEKCLEHNPKVKASKKKK